MAASELPSSLQGLTLEALLQPREADVPKEDGEGSCDTPSSALVTSFPPEVESAMASVLASWDPLDAADFDPVGYINERFPSEQSLNQLDDTIAELTFNVGCIDEDIRRIVRNQTHSGDDAANALQEAQEAIGLLFKEIRDIKAKAGESEAMVRDITRDIKQLDTAKKNLTSAITTLNHLHMLVGGVTTLQNLSTHRQYSEAAMLLQGLMEVLDHFKNYGDIPQIKELSEQVDRTRREMGDQISADFHTALSGENAKNFAPTKQLAEACLVVNVLEPRVKQNLMKFIISRELAEYNIIFAEGEEGTWLDKVDNRYNWLKRHLIDFEERLGPMFPPEWEVSERIAVEFCYMTRKQLEKGMFKRKHEMDTKLLLHAIQRTTNFESLLARRFTGTTIEQMKTLKEEEERERKEEKSRNPFEEGEEKIEDPNNPFYESKEDSEKAAKAPADPSATPFTGIISQCFEPYLSIYIESQDKNLQDLIDRAAQEQSQRGHANLAVEGSTVLHSCGDLFMFYKKCMVQCAQLSTGDSLLALANVFKKYLKEYATKVLLGNLPKTAGGGGAGLTGSSSISSSMTKVTKDLKDFSTSGIIQNFQSLLKEGDSDHVKLNDDEKVLLCTFLVTSEYCLETTQQLEGKLREKIDPDLALNISFASEQDTFHGVINNCLGFLVRDLDCQCEPALINMSKMVWSTIESVGDQSSYVTSLSNHIKLAIPVVRDNLVSSKKYFTQFCVKFINTFIPKFIQHLYRCKPISTVGAEQLLLDTHSMKTLLLDLPSVGSKVSIKKAPASYTKIVIKGMTRAEMTLKVVMSQATPVEAFVEQYIKLVPDVDLLEFQRVLDMKGLRKVDQLPYVEVFKKTVPEAASTSIVLSPVHAQVKKAPGAEESSRIKKLENLIKRL